MEIMIIAVDFDGTIAKTRYPYIIELIPEASYISKWRKMGHKVVLWTCRMGEPLESALAFCKENNIEFDGVNENVQTKYDDDTRKISADLYIDDKCVMNVIEQWHEVDARLNKRTVTKEITVVDHPKTMRARGRR